MRRHYARLLHITLTASFMQVAIAAAIAGPYEDAKLPEIKETMRPLCAFIARSRNKGTS